MKPRKGRPDACRVHSTLQRNLAISPKPWQAHQPRQRMFWPAIKEMQE
jgi:hypothetical protein